MLSARPSKRSPLARLPERGNLVKSLVELLGTGSSPDCWRNIAISNDVGSVKRFSSKL
jgi:hypothetical protein